jgi:hypothetical protein
VEKNAGEGIRTLGPLQDKALNLAPLTRLGYPCDKKNRIITQFIMRWAIKADNLNISSFIALLETNRDGPGSVAW